MVFDGGYVSDVILSNLTIECTRHDWFWWGDGDPIHFNIKRRSEVDGQHRDHEPPAGAIRNVLIRNLVARGKGTSTINGHPDSWLDGVSLDNIKLFLSHDPASPLEKTTDAVKIRWARDVKLKDVEVHWERPESPKWESALRVQDVRSLEIDGVALRQATLKADLPAVVLEQVQDAVIRNSRAAEGTTLFLSVNGSDSRGIYLLGNDFTRAKNIFRLGAGVQPSAVKTVSNLAPD
jgi:hypothetical protein